MRERETEIRKEMKMEIFCLHFKSLKYVLACVRVCVRVSACVCVNKLPNPVSAQMRNLKLFNAKFKVLFFSIARKLQKCVRGGVNK